jgi:serine/threonine protein kinase
MKITTRLGFIYHDLASPPRGVLENYALEEEIGSGSYSRVYKAYDRKEGNIFAVKAIHAVRMIHPIPKSFSFIFMGDP